MGRQRLGALLLGSVGLLGLGGGALLWGVRHDAPLPSGAQLAGYSLAGVRPSRLPHYLEHLRSILAEQPVSVEQAPMRPTKLKDWGVELDVAATHQAILEAWRRVPLWERLFGKPRFRVQPQWATLPELFQAQLSQFRHLERPPRDARVRFTSGQVEILAEQNGWTLNQEESYRNLLDALQALPTARTVFPLALHPTPPRITREHLRAITGVMASYTSRFPSNQTPRNHNIRLAAQALDGRVLMPGEQISYNQTVGKRTLQRGFRVAPVIVRGEKQLGVGGGICQVASTLFNAALLSDLKIVRRVNHSIPVDYVPLGRDATATDTGIDLVIENPFDHPIAIAAEAGRSALTIRVLGPPQPHRRVVLRTERVALLAPPMRRVNDPHLPLGTQRVVQKGSAGMRVILWREVYDNGTLVKRERVATSVYRAQPRVIAVGSKLPPAPQGILSPKGDDTDAQTADRDCGR
ncbi:MAG: VanW family protein [Fimbriimonadales bacterium]